MEQPVGGVVRIEALLARMHWLLAPLAKRLLGWEPKVTFRELVRIMVDADLEDAGLPTSGEGRKILAAKGLPVGSKL